MTDPQSADTPEMRPNDPNSEHAQPERDLVEDDTLDDLSGDGSDAPASAGGIRRLIVLIGSVLLLLAIGCGVAAAVVPNSPAPMASAPTGSAAAIPTSSVPTALPLPQAIGDATSTEPVAQVGDVTITRGDFVRAYQPGAVPSEVIDQLIQVELVLQQAQIEGVTVDQSKIDATIAEIKGSVANDTEYAALLQQNKISSEEELRALLSRDQIVEQMILVHTTLEQAHARHILLSATGDQIEARKAEAEALLKQIQDGADFVQLASEKSEDPGSKDNGGDLGWAARGMFVTEFDEAIFSMKKGEVRLIQSQFGWHIIELLDLPEVRALGSTDMLSTAQGQQAFTDTFLPWVKQLQASAQAAQKIKILLTDDQLVTQP